MALVSAKSRISFGLVSLSVSVLMGAMVLGIIPDRTEAVLKGRARLCESVAVSSSAFVSRGDLRRLKMTLEAIASRDDDVLSVGVRKSSGELIVEVGEHQSKWEHLSRDRSSETQIQVPIRVHIPERVVLIDNS